MKRNIIFIILIVALLTTTVINVVDRMTVENQAKSVEIVLAYKDTAELATQSEHNLDWWFKHFKSLGANSVAIEEETFRSLIDSQKELEAEVLHNLKKDTLWRQRYPESFVEYVDGGDYDLNDVVFVSTDQALKTFILDGLKLHYSETLFTVYEDGDRYAILFDGTFEDTQYSQIYKSVDAKGEPVSQLQDIIGSAIYDYPINFDSEKVEAVQQAGLIPVLRPWNNKNYPEKLLEAYQANLEKYDIKPEMWIFAGKEVLGYPSEYQALYDYIEENEITPVLIEAGNQRSNIDQKDLMKLTEDINYRAVRMMPLVGYLQERFQYYNYDGGQEIENVMFRAITERNVRVIFFRPFLYGSDVYVTNPDEYEISFYRLNERLKSHNIVLGDFSVMPYKDDSLVSGIVTGLGLIAIGLLTLRYFIKLKAKYEYVLLVVGGLLISAALVVAPNLGRQLLALTAAITISSVGAVILIATARTMVIDKKIYTFGRTLLKCLAFTILLGGLALLGGMIVGGLLSHSKYLLEIEFFRGVKASEMLPLVVFLIVYFLKFGYKRSIKELKEHSLIPQDFLRVLDENIKIKYIVFSAFAGLILYIYIARSGHETSLQPTNIEMIFRNFLEMKLLARPRTKEFLFAIPALMVFAYVSIRAYKPLIALFGIPAVVTFTSIINTFCHLRTPIYLSVIRTIYAIGFGAIIGLVGILVIEGGVALYHKITKKVVTSGTLENLGEE